MTEFPETHDSLIVQVRDPQNREAWNQFVLIYRLARRRGLQDADAQDLVQNVLIAVASAICGWEKSNESVRFRHWLRRVARNAIINALSRQPRDQAAGGSSVNQLLMEHPHEAFTSEQEIELEYRRELHLQAVGIIQGDFQADTWKAFELTVIAGQSIPSAAEQLGKPIGTIYASRSRVMRRLRDTVRKLEQQEL